jgi:hypothetical protein
MSAPPSKIARELALSDVLGELRHDIAQASATLHAAIVTRSEVDVRVLVSLANGAVARVAESMTTLREMLIAK